jgi:hypothetical protein
VSTALKLHALAGPARSREYMHTLLEQACHLLLGAWGTHLLAPLDMCASMALVGLPDGVSEAGAGAPAAAAEAGGVRGGPGAPGMAARAGPGAASSAAAAEAGGVRGGPGAPGMAARAGPGAASSADAKYVQDVLHYRHRIEVPVKCIQGRLYVRISAALYNELADYRALAVAVQGMRR